MMGYDQLERVLGDAASAYAEACRKHPVFPKNPSNEKAEDLKRILTAIQEDLNRSDEDVHCTIRSVQSEELLEAIIEAKRKDWTAAKHETLHLIATALRAYEFYAEMEKSATA